MADTRKKKPKDAIEDEPGAEQRFKGILKRALNTPPPRKQDQNKPKKAKNVDRG